MLFVLFFSLGTIYYTLGYSWMGGVSFFLLCLLVFVNIYGVSGRFRRNYSLLSLVYICIASYVLSTVAYICFVSLYPISPIYPSIVEQHLLITQQKSSDTYIAQTHKNFIGSEKHTFSIKVDQGTMQEGDVILVVAYPLWRNQINPNYTGDVNREKIAYTHHIDGRLFLKKPLVVGHESSYLTSIRAIIRDRLAILYPRQEIYALVGGMLLGETATLSDDLKELFRTSGLSHILVVSGGNILLVTVFLSYLFFLLPVWVRSVVIAWCIVGYAWLCGLDASVLRALCMALIGLVALIPGRSVSIWRILGITRCFMLMFNPFYLLYDVGFLLSFSAVAGLVLFRDSIPYFDRVYINHIAGYIYPSIAATCGVSPIVFFFFNTLNVLGVIANILIGFCIPIITVGSGVSLLFHTTWLGQGLAYIVTMCSNRIFLIAMYTTKYGIYIQIVSPMWKLGFFVFMISLAIWAIWEANTVQSSERSMP